MHEYHKAVHIIENATEQAQKEGKTKVSRINLVIGDSSGFSGDSIRLYFEEASVGTLCEGAEIAVKPANAMLNCPQCSQLFPKVPFSYACPVCGTEGEPSEIGKEIMVESIETE